MAKRKGISTGTSAQRTIEEAGHMRFNTTTNLLEYYNGSQWKSIDSPPVVSSIDVTEVDSQAGGNQTIVITGGNFASGATVTFVGNAGTDFSASTVTVDSVSQITTVAPKASFLNAQEPYGVKVENTSGLSATLASQINVDTSPSWSTASGNLGSVEEGDSANFSATATDSDGDTIVYSETTSVLSSAGFSLNSSTGAITGTASDVSADTTNTFTLRATANSKTADRSFNIITTNTPTFSQVMTAQTAGSNRNLGILIDPANYTSGSATNESGHPVANGSTPLNNLSVGGTGAGKYFEATSGGDSFMTFGAPTGLTNNTSDAWGYAGWWRPNFEIDDTGNSGVLWCLNDGDWGPNGQIGVRWGQSNGVYLHSGSTSGLANFGLPQLTYTNRWIFLCVWHRVSGGRFVAQAHADDTNLTLHANDTTSSSTGNSSGHNLVIGARPDYTAAHIPTGTRIGGQMAWFGGGDSFISTSQGVSDAQTKFEAIFDATKGRYA